MLYQALLQLWAVGRHWAGAALVFVLPESSLPSSVKDLPPGPEPVGPEGPLARGPSGCCTRVRLRPVGPRPLIPAIAIIGADLAAQSSAAQ